MSDPIYNPAMRTIIAAALVLFCTACTEPAVPRYQLSPPTAPSPVPTPTPTPPPTSTPAPLALVFAVGPSNPVAGTSAAFVTTVTPAPSAPVAYTWSFGDGVNEQTGGGTTFHTYGRAGAYEAAVTITDAIGRTVAGNAHVNVQNPPPGPAPDPPPPAPTPSFTIFLSAAPNPIAQGSPTTLTATVTRLNGAPTATSFGWDCENDGFLDGTTAGNSSTCAYATTGNKTAKVTVTGGAVMGTATTTLTVSAPAASLTAAINCAIGASTTPTTCNVSAVTYGSTPIGSGAVTNVDWDWGDGTKTIAGGISASHTYLIPATHTVVATITATTVDGPKTAIASKSVVIP